MNRIYAPHDASQQRYQEMVRAEQIISQQTPARQDVARYLYALPVGGNRFLASLAAQLDRYGRLSPRQWECAADNMARSQRPAQPAQAAAPRDEDPLPNVPEGHYATLSRTGNNDLDFWRVDRPAEGTYAGRVFVKRVIGGKPDTNVRRAEVRQALEAIVAAGVDAAGALYGQTLGQCRTCNRHLTDETSRALGQGPECRSRKA